MAIGQTSLTAVVTSKDGEKINSAPQQIEVNIFIVFHSYETTGFYYTGTTFVRIRITENSFNGAIANFIKQKYGHSRAC